MKKKILVVFGTRPEAIKMAPVIKALELEREYFECIVCNTGQHRELVDQVLTIFNIRPKIDLNVMITRQNLSEITTNVINSMKEVLDEYRPDVMLVHGDTTTAMATSIAGFYANIPIGHVEAGLRTWKINNPFPEEFNRQLISKVAKYHFTPTETSKSNLLKEGFDTKDIYVTGNTVIDSIQWIIKKIKYDKHYSKRLDDSITDILKFDFKSRKRKILITSHRRENHAGGLENICNAVLKLSDKHPEIDFIFPVHPNPVVREVVTGIIQKQPNVHIIEPMKYDEFVQLLNQCWLVLTDSGGIQEEAPGLGKPVLVLREQTERPEALMAGTVKIVGTNANNIILMVEDLLNDEQKYLKMSEALNPYGDGFSASRIVSVLKNSLQNIFKIEDRL